jgi:hypothetical protein
MFSGRVLARLRRTSVIPKLQSVAVDPIWEEILVDACDQGKNAAKWTRLSCGTFAANAARLQRHALAYNLANFLRTLPGVGKWSLTSPRESS